MTSPMPGPTGFLLHPASSLHDPGWGHPDHQGRLRALASAVSADMIALHRRVMQLEARSATEEEILRVHTPEHVRRVRDAVDRAMEEERSIPLDPDTRVSGASWDAVLGSSGALLAAIDGVARGVIRNAFVATRPPGHHATPDRAMGFCLFNHVAVGARYLQDQGVGRRILIVDWDVHHGNGTQEVFYTDPEVFYLSLHQSPHFPGTGRAEETGAGPGTGTTLNVPLPPGTPRDEYRGRFFESLADVRQRFDPEFVLISCGFDVLRGDPLGGQELEPEDLHGFTRAVMDEFGTSGGRVIAALEGGYGAEVIGPGAVAVVRALADLAMPPGDLKAP